MTLKRAGFTCRVMLFLPDIALINGAALPWDSEKVPISQVNISRLYLLVTRTWNNKIYYTWDPCHGPQLLYICGAGRVRLDTSHFLLPQKDVGWKRIAQMQPFIHKACPRCWTLQSMASEARAETLPDFLASVFPSGRKQTKPIKMQTRLWKAWEKGDTVAASQAQNCIALIFLSNMKTRTRFSLSSWKMMKSWVHNEGEVHMCAQNNPCSPPNLFNSRWDCKGGQRCFKFISRPSFPVQAHSQTQKPIINTAHTIKLGFSPPSPFQPVNSPFSSICSCLRSCITV